LCEWYKDTANGNNFAIPPTAGTYHTASTPFVSPPSYLDTLQARAADPAYGGYFASITDPHNPINNATIAASETVLLAHSSGSGSGTSGLGVNCNTGSDNSNQTAPGEFGWLCTGNGCACSANITGPTYLGSTGANAVDCGTVFTTSRNTMQPIYIPVFSGVSGTGSNATYTLAGFAAFVVTGWNVHGVSPSSCDSIITANDSSLNSPYALAYTGTSCATAFPGRSTPDYADYCSNYMGVNCGGNSQQAIYGYFTKALIPASELPGGAGTGTDFGATSVSLSG
jgi:hypothetical protein